jgi:hypothetical protein
VNEAERLKLALSLRRQRLTYQEIADRCSYANRGAARNAIKNALKKDIQIDKKEYRKLELEILDTIHQKVWVAAFGEGEKTEINLWAVDRLLKLSDARRDLLNLDETPEEELANQNYTKKIILTHSPGGDNANPNS